MTDDLPEISVIIPTRNRCAELKRMLDSLCTQTCSFGHFEVIAVADGCTDDTVQMLRNYNAPYALRTIEQLNRGPGAARNNGASFARGRLLIFLDDDLEPTPHLIDAHRETHRRRPGGVVIGPYPPVFHGRNFINIHVRAWWSSVFDSILQPGHRFSFRDLLSGNLSVPTALFFVSTASTRISGFTRIMSLGCA